MKRIFPLFFLFIFFPRPTAPAPLYPDAAAPLQPHRPLAAWRAHLHPLLRSAASAPVVPDITRPRPSRPPMLQPAASAPLGPALAPLSVGCGSSPATHVLAPPLRGSLRSSTRRNRSLTVTTVVRRQFRVEHSLLPTIFFQWGIAANAWSKSWYMKRLGLRWGSIASKFDDVANLWCLLGP
jgi:hypothetical protein